MYSFLTLKDAETNATVSEKMRCKGIQKAAQKKFRHQDYLNQLQRPAENAVVNRRIGSNLHQIYTWESKKRGLCAYDDKRFLLEDGVHSLAFGHHSITARVQDDRIEEPRELVIAGDELLPGEQNGDDLLDVLEGQDPVEAARFHPLPLEPDTCAPQSDGSSINKRAASLALSDEPPSHRQKSTSSESTPRPPHPRLANLGPSPAERALFSYSATPVPQSPAIASLNPADRSLFSALNPNHATSSSSARPHPSGVPWSHHNAISPPTP